MKRFAVAVASSVPEESVKRASASATWRPEWTTVPVVVTVPVSALIGLTNRTDRSSVLNLLPAGSVVWTAQAAAESSKVAWTPP